MRKVIFIVCVAACTMVFFRCGSSTPEVKISFSDDPAIDSYFATLRQDNEGGTKSDMYFRFDFVDTDTNNNTTIIFPSGCAEIPIPNNCGYNYTAGTPSDRLLSEIDSFLVQARAEGENGYNMVGANVTVTAVFRLSTGTVCAQGTLHVTEKSSESANKLSPAGCP